MESKCLSQGNRIGGEQRTTAADWAVHSYTVQKRSIRSIAEELGRSYGFVYRLLTSAGVTLRQRGGSRERTK
jgi:transposase